MSQQIVKRFIISSLFLLSGTLLQARDSHTPGGDVDQKNNRGAVPTTDREGFKDCTTNNSESAPKHDFLRAKWVHVSPSGDFEPGVKGEPGTECVFLVYTKDAQVKGLLIATGGPDRPEEFTHIKGSFFPGFSDLDPNRHYIVVNVSGSEPKVIPVPCEACSHSSDDEIRVRDKAALKGKEKVSRQEFVSSSDGAD